MKEEMTEKSDSTVMQWLEWKWRWRLPENGTWKLVAEFLGRIYYKNWLPIGPTGVQARRSGQEPLVSLVEAQNGAKGLDHMRIPKLHYLWHALSKYIDSLSTETPETLCWLVKVACPWTNQRQFKLQIIHTCIAMHRVCALVLKLPPLHIACSWPWHTWESCWDDNWQIAAVI